MGARVYVDDRVAIERDDNGVVHVRAEVESDLYRGLGFAHAHDRGVQLLLMRILGQGRGAELLDAGLMETDRFFRRMNWWSGLDRQTGALSERARKRCGAYCEGVNAALAQKLPWEMKLLGYRPEPWRTEDSLLLARMTGYLTLAQSQGELERLLVQMIQAGVDDDRLEALFPGGFAGLDRALLSKVELLERIVPREVRFGPVPRMMASNNWVVAGRHSASGRPILANDPHLEVNRIPAVWYEAVLETPRRWAVSATMPGLPGLLLARTNDLAWGATYTFADAIDSWIEHVRDGKVRRGDAWVPLRRRVEIIARKGAEPQEAVFYETDEHGVLDGAPGDEGYSLATRWSGADAGARSIEAFLDLFEAKTVEEGMELLGRVELSFNWVLADAGGHIGYQMSGLLPVRRAGVTGLVPLPGWDPDNDWRGFHPVEDLPRILDPERGFIVTANDDLNRYGRAHPINADMGSYRADRIAEVLAAIPQAGVEEMRRLQMDVRSRHAERFMEILRPLLPDTPAARVLRAWDFEYDAASSGADAFERFYAELRREVFGGALGMNAVDHLASETGIFTDFYDAFDRVLLEERSPWFGERTQAEVFRAVAERALRDEPRPWGERQQFVMRHLLFGDKLPKVAGFDRGPFTMIGGRSTVHQGQLYRSGGRATTFAPSFRLVTDFAEPGWHSCLAGGPSDRRFSRWYCSEMAAWGEGRLKRVAPFADT